MIDWLTSKAGMMLAIGVIVAFVLGAFGLMHADQVDREGQAVADTISGAVNALAALDGEAQVNLSSGQEGELPQTIDGRAYDINITRDMVIVSQGDRRWQSGFLEPVYPGGIGNRSMNLSDFQELSDEQEYLIISSGQPLILERIAVDVSGRVVYVTVITGN